MKLKSVPDGDICSLVASCCRTSVDSRLTSHLIGQLSSTPSILSSSFMMASSLRSWEELVSDISSTSNFTLPNLAAETRKTLCMSSGLSFWHCPLHLFSIRLLKSRLSYLMGHQACYSSPSRWWRTSPSYRSSSRLWITMCSAFKVLLIQSTKASQDTINHTVRNIKRLIFSQTFFFYQCSKWKKKKKKKR